MVSNEAEDRMAHSPEVMLHVLQKITRELLDRQYHLLERTWMRQEPGDPTLFSALLLTAMSPPLPLHVPGLFQPQMV